MREYKLATRKQHHVIAVRANQRSIQLFYDPNREDLVDQIREAPEIIRLIQQPEITEDKPVLEYKDIS